MTLQNNTLYIPQGGNCQAPRASQLRHPSPPDGDRGSLPRFELHDSVGQVRYRPSHSRRLSHRLPRTCCASATASSTAVKRIRAEARTAVKACPSTKPSTCRAIRATAPYVGINQAQCFGCRLHAGGFAGGYPASPFTLNAGVSMRGVRTRTSATRWSIMEFCRSSANSRRNMALKSAAGQPPGTPGDPADLRHRSESGHVQHRDYRRSLQEIQPACSTCQSVGNGLSMTSSFGFGRYAAGSVKLESRFQPRLYSWTSYVWSHAWPTATLR